MTVTDFKLRSSTVATLVEVEQLGHAWSGGAARQPHSDGRGPGCVANDVGVRGPAVSRLKDPRRIEPRRGTALGYPRPQRCR